jgi:class 3 adenylate cyclase/tetratricopeptide (TPR) repeat protein
MATGHLDHAGSVSPSAQFLVPYLPRLVIDWIREMPEVTHRVVNGTGVFADISGFTNLTERLARKGKVGAEEIGDVLNVVFEQLLDAAYEYGAGLVKWGGDAVLLLFDGERHAEMACRAAFDMQRVMSRIGHIQTHPGTVRLRMSIGVSSGDIDFLLVGKHFRELIVTGPVATEVAQMEVAAEAGEIVISPATAALLSDGGATHTGAAKGPGFLLVSAPELPPAAIRGVVPGDIDLTNFFCAPLRDHLLSGAVDNEHRQATVAFIEFSGTDDLLRREGPAALTAAVTHFVDACQDAAMDNDVTMLSSDVYENGGKVIMISGAPRSAGDDDARVLSATRQVIDSAGVLELRAGVNRGRIVAGDYGTSYRRCYSITGDIVNLAARLMTKAKPGEIVSTQAVVDHSRTSFATTPMAPFMVKGKTEPIAAVLVGPKTELRPGTPQNQMGLVGRDVELATLLAAAAGAEQGRGRMVKLVGPPGIGKSRLLEELGARTTHAVLWTDGDIYARTTPYQPFQRLFRKQLGLSDESKLTDVAAALTHLVMTRAPHLLPWLPLLGIVAGVELTETPEVAVIDADVRKERLEAVTSEALGILLSGPTILIFNDVQFMDDASTELVIRLGNDAVLRPWVVVAAMRPESRLAPMEFATGDDITLQPLDASIADDFLRAATEGNPLPEHQLHALVERAGGNPLFLKELAANALDPGSLEALPDSVEGLIAARIDRLGSEQRRLLRAAAVLGMQLEVDLLRAVLRSEGSTLADALDCFDQLGEFILPTEGDHLQFAHHLIRETAYEGLPYSRRVMLHATTAQLMEERLGDRVDEQAALLSLHTFFGQRFDAAWQYSRTAADRARAMYSLTDAADLYKRALEAASHLRAVDDGEVATVSESLADAYDYLASFDLAEEALRQARERTKHDKLRTAQLALKTSIVRERVGQYAVALRWLTKGLAAVEGDERNAVVRVRGELMARYARIRAYQGRSRDGIAWARKAIVEALKCDEQSTVAHSLEYIDICEMNLGIVSETPPAERALRIYESLGDVLGQASTRNTLGGRCYYLGRWDEALQHYSAAEDAWRACGSIWGPAVPMASRGEILSDQGHLSNAAALVEEALRLSKGSHKDSDVAFCHYLLARIRARSGSFDEAIVLYDEARSYYRQTGLAILEVFVDGLEAESRLMAGRSKAALAGVEDALRRATRLDSPATVLPLFLRVQGVALTATGRAEEGAQALLESLDIARKSEALHEVAFTLDSLVCCAADKNDRWAEERDMLMAKLGIRSIPTLLNLHPE